MNLETISNEVIVHWGEKTLAEFRREAECEETEAVYEAMRLDHGPRAVLLMCVTRVDQIATLERVLTFADERKEDEDWNELTLLEVSKRTALRHGCAYESFRDRTGKPIAIVLCSTEPRSMEILTFLFNLPA